MSEFPDGEKEWCQFGAKPVTLGSVKQPLNCGHNNHKKQVSLPGNAED